MIERQGGDPAAHRRTMGDIIPLEALRDQLARSGPIKAVVLVHAETSTGAAQPLEDVGAPAAPMGHS